ncbi:MAG: hypothetical protein J1G01_05115 [Clostridiales bacterium]|nr:hypothetical protein [Clostridiales bacterium]
MRGRITAELDKYIKHGKAFDYLVDAIEMYDLSGDTLKRVFGEVAKKHNVSVCATERLVALAAANADTEKRMTAKELIAFIKERIMFEIDE